MRLIILMCSLRTLCNRGCSWISSPSPRRGCCCRRRISRRIGGGLAGWPRISPLRDSCRTTTDCCTSSTFADSSTIPTPIYGRSFESLLSCRSPSEAETERERIKSRFVPGGEGRRSRIHLNAHQILEEGEVDEGVVIGLPLRLTLQTSAAHPSGEQFHLFQQISLVLQYYVVDLGRGRSQDHLRGYQDSVHLKHRFYVRQLFVEVLEILGYASKARG